MLEIKNYNKQQTYCFNYKSPIRELLNEKLPLSTKKPQKTQSFNNEFAKHNEELAKLPKEAAHTQNY